MENGTHWFLKTEGKCKSRNRQRRQQPDTQQKETRDQGGVVVSCVAGLLLFDDLFTLFMSSSSPEGLRC